jgi:hypothetical protein
MNKYRTLTTLLEQLAPVLATGQLVPGNAEARNQEAISFHHPDTPGLGAYIFTYGQPAGRLGIVLEYPSPDGAPPPVVTEAENLSPAHVIEMLMAHFDVPLRV